MLLHNPTAGDEDHSKDKLIELIEENGFNCRYSSTKKKEYKDIESDVDFLIVAGGDGTVRKITKELLERSVLEKTFPIALLPLGTANNIAKTLEIQGTDEEIIKAWHHQHIKKYDVGRLCDFKKAPFFLESFGYGVFPYLMMEMKKVDEKEIDTPEKKLEKALEVLMQIILTYEPHKCTLVINGKDYSGKYLMAEVMNTRSIGPNLYLNPSGNVGDGELEVVLVPEEDKKKFASYIMGKINGVEEDYTFKTIKAKEVEISWEGTHVHADDEILKLDKSEKVRIEIKESLLEFLVP